MVRTGFLMFLFAAGLVVSFMETINSAINSKDTQKVSIYKLFQKILWNDFFTFLSVWISNNMHTISKISTKKAIVFGRLYNYVLIAQKLHIIKYNVQLFTYIMKWFSGSCPPSLYHLTHLANVNPTYIFPIYYSVQKVFNDTNQKQSWQLFFYVSWLSEAIWKKKSKQKKWVTKFSLSWNSKRTFEGNSDPCPWYINESWSMIYWVDRVYIVCISFNCEWSS